MPRHREADRVQIVSDTRQSLLQAAAAAFARDGYAGANIDRISRTAGFAKGTIYNYFDSKRALMLALIDETAQAHLEFVADLVRQEDDPRRRLERFFEAGFAFVTTYLAPARVMVNTIYGPDSEFKERMWLAYRPLFELVAQEIVAAGLAQGMFRSVEPEATAVLLMTLYLGTGSQVDDEGRVWLDPHQVADFAWHAIRQNRPDQKES